jgi:photosystem II stability/assembly factor-like uncharacterized protein
MNKILLPIVLLFFLINDSIAQSTVKIDHNTFGAIKARNIGPATMSGRISSLDALHEDPNILYVGSAGGGVWKSKNGGTTFKPVFDEYTQSIGCVRIDQNNPETVWVGTGEPWTRNSVSVGTGIYKTTDGGEKWKLLGLENTERIAHIIIDPTNSDIVYVAALGHLWGPNEDRGLYKTEDGGETWQKILYIDENTGCSDIAMDPFNSNVLYAGMWQFRRSAHYFNSGGKGSGLYKSEDGGKTWKELTTDLPEGEKGRIALSISPADSSVYALIESDETALYRSKDNGVSWEMMNKSRSVNERPFYFAKLVADPVKKDRIYKPGFYLYVSSNGGEHFQSPSVEGGRYHPDVHDLYVNPNDNRLLYIATDGGVYVSRDKGNTWAMIRNLPLAQFYHVSADMKKPYYVYGGLQDNNSWYGPSEKSGGIRNEDWKKVGFGDGFYAYADMYNEDIVYWQWQGGQFAKANIKTGEFKSIKPFKAEDTEELRFNWNAPVIFSRDGKRMYVGAQYLYISEDQGETWKRISEDLTTDDPERQKQETTGGLTLDNSTAENHCTIITINESPLDKNVIWVGTDDGNIQVTKDGGKSWENVTANVPGLPAKTWCSYVEPSNHEKAVCYASFDGHKSGDMKPYVYKTEDYGKTWTSLVSEDLPIYIHTVKEDFKAPNLLFLGTEFGLYTSIDGGKNWSRFKSGIPKVSIREVVIHPRENDLILGTHGRGILIIDNIDPLRHISEDVINSDFAFLPSEKYIIKGGMFGGSYAGDDEFTGSNPPEAAIISYYLKKRHIFGNMTIEIYNEKDSLVDEIVAGKRKGINRVPWYIRMDPPKVPSSPQLVGFAMQGPTFAPGKYKVKVIKGSKSYESEIELILNPDSEHSDEDRKVRLHNLMKAYNLLEELAYIDKQFTDISDHIEKYSDKLSKKDKKKLSALADICTEYHKILVATKKGNITGEEQMREKLGELYGFIMFYRGKPTNSQIDALELLEKELKKIEAELETIKKNDLVAVNAIFEKNEIKQIELISKEAFLKED